MAFEHCFFARKFAAGKQHGMKIRSKLIFIFFLSGYDKVPEITLAVLLGDVTSGELKFFYK